jgi:serine/threonine protein phosphatase PrpC
MDNSGIDIAFSGCTFISVIIIDSNVYCINVGDSKAILCQGISTI